MWIPRPAADKRQLLTQSGSINLHCFFIIHLISLNCTPLPLTRSLRASLSNSFLVLVFFVSRSIFWCHWCITSLCFLKVRIFPGVHLGGIWITKAFLLRENGSWPSRAHQMLAGEGSQFTREPQFQNINYTIHNLRRKICRIHHLQLLNTSK